MEDSQRAQNKKSNFDNFISDIRDYVFLFSILIGLSTALFVFFDKINIGEKQLNQALFFIFFLILIIWFHIAVKALDYFKEISDSKKRSFSEIIFSLEVILFTFLLMAPIFSIFSVIFQKAPDSFLVSSLVVVFLFMIFGTGMISEWMEVKYNTIKSSLFWILGCILFIIGMVVALSFCLVYNSDIFNYLIFIISPLFGIWMLFFINSIFLLVININNRYIHVHPFIWLRNKIQKR
ncbi:hypothetical protein [Methanolacinia paynteri]|uniref:hypothetical protein n=1 Tax=Methanolacinia paynteri TaxID=230356 RepID=UPI00064E5C6E|nr:hypothetical protein [Methanolacinia paynteri]